MTSGGPSDNYRSRYPLGDREEPTITIVEAVAKVKDVTPEDLDPFQNTIDADHLNSLFSKMGNDSITISLHYEGCAVTVDGPEIYVEAID